MNDVLAFDVYGTLIDTAGVIKTLERMVGEKASLASDLWRSKQLEYSFRRGLMQNYQDFSVCTRQALDFVCQALQLSLDDAAKSTLLASYRGLPAFPDVGAGLDACRAAGFRLFAFSNGKPDDVVALLSEAAIGDYFVDVVSTDELKSFKPNPGVYAHFLRRAGASGSQAWLISGNPFDVLGAISAGMRGAWVKRTPQAVFDPWEIDPTVTIANLGELAAAVQKTE